MVSSSKSCEIQPAGGDDHDALPSQNGQDYEVTEDSDGDDQEATASQNCDKEYNGGDDHDALPSDGKDYEVTEDADGDDQEATPSQNRDKEYNGGGDHDALPNDGKDYEVTEYAGGDDQEVTASQNRDKEYNGGDDHDALPSDGKDYEVTEDADGDDQEATASQNRDKEYNGGDDHRVLLTQNSVSNNMASSSKSCGIQPDDGDDQEALPTQNLVSNNVASSSTSSEIQLAGSVDQETPPIKNSVSNSMALLSTSSEIQPAGSVDQEAPPTQNSVSNSIASSSKSCEIRHADSDNQEAPSAQNPVSNNMATSSKSCEIQPADSDNQEAPPSQNPVSNNMPSSRKSCEIQPADSDDQEALPTQNPVSSNIASSSKSCKIQPADSDNEEAPPTQNPVSNMALSRKSCEIQPADSDDQEAPLTQNPVSKNMASSSKSCEIQLVDSNDQEALPTENHDTEYEDANNEYEDCRQREIESLEKLVNAEEFFIETILPEMNTRHKIQMTDLCGAFKKLKLPEKDGGGGVAELRMMKKLVLRLRKRVSSTPITTATDVNNFNDNLFHSINNTNNNNNQVDCDMTEEFQNSLKLKYQELGPELKRCLLCLAAFPVNAEMKRRVLVQWWIGEGFLPPQDDLSRTAEHSGDLFLDELVSRGFLKVTLHIPPMRVNTWTMEPSVRSMVVKLAADEKFFDIDLEQGNVMAEYSDSTRSCLKLGKGLTNLQDLKKLKTMFNVDETLLTLNPEWFLKMRDARVLHLGSWQATGTHHIEVLTTKSRKSNYKHALDGLESVDLRLLNFEGFSTIRKLPRSIPKLTNLTILNFRACHNLESLPKEIGSLTNLTHLDMSECYLLEDMPIGIAKLTNIQVLKGFVVTDNNSKSTCTLWHLSKLKELRKLALYVRMIRKLTWDLDLRFLHGLRALTTLKIVWGRSLGPRSSATASGENSSSTTQESSGTESLPEQDLLPPHLEKLKLECQPSPYLPWLRVGTMKNLKKLCLIGGNLSKLDLHDYSPDGWNVEELQLKYMKTFELEWTELQKQFPKLKLLKKIHCPKLCLFKCNDNGVWTAESDRGKGKGKGRRYPQKF